VNKRLTLYLKSPPTIPIVRGGWPRSSWPGEFPQFAERAYLIPTTGEEFCLGSISVLIAGDLVSRLKCLIQTVGWECGNFPRAARLGSGMAFVGPKYNLRAWEAPRSY
jgi:hypothetical protein